ncbi:MAG TPA: GAF domain-containing protein [Cyclobacteriaceae bacterium]|nr:GAF domain-containing protein [Cyclobacteriaceae bacterium]
MQPSNYDSDFCGSLPIHLTNLIQPYGILLVIDKDNLNIVQASENTEPVFSKPVSEVVNNPLISFIDGASAATLREKLQNDFNNKIPSVWEIGGERYVVLVHRHENYLLAEIDSTAIKQRSQDAFIDVYQELKYAMTAIEGAESLEKACELAASELKRISGFDKVMVYRFDAEWNGYVIAEAMEPDMESYFQFTFPASDIPKQARQLYLKNPYRFIPDRNYRPVKLYPVVNPITSSFIDLSDCNLRSVASVHVEYLKNMGVTASMSTRILYEDQLWGLIACHHKTAKHMSYEMCSVFEMLSGIISMKVASLQNANAASRSNFISATWARIVESVYRSEDLYSNLLAADGAMKLFDATGIALTKGSKFETAGIVPRDEVLEELVLWLHTRELRKVYSTDSLREEYEYAKDFNGEASGLLVIPINASLDRYLILFRPEKVRVINWGGNPDERIQFEKNEKNYHPRNSFKQWQQKVSGVSLPWRKEELNAAETLRSFIYEYETSPVTR